MNRIKEVLEEKGIKQTWLAEKIGKVLARPMPMSVIADSQVLNYCMRLLPLGVEAKDLLVDNIELKK